MFSAYENIFTTKIKRITVIIIIVIVIIIIIIIDGFEVNSVE